MLQVACVAEGNYVAHSAAMLHSVLANSGFEEVGIHYLHPPEFPREIERPLAEMVEAMGGTISFVEVGDQVCAGLPVVGFTRKATWYRIFLPQLLPDLDRVLFLDCDLLVIESLAQLWETDLDDYYLASVMNVFPLDSLGRPRRLGFDDARAYFNAGVMLMNLRRMREEGMTETLREYGVAHADELSFRDQDVLNVVMGSRRKALHPRWNLMNSMLSFPHSAYVVGLQSLAEAIKGPAIRHFEGPGRNKPWHYECRFEDRALYFDHRRATPWPDVEIEGRTLAAMVRQAPWRTRKLAGRLRRRLSA